MIVDPETFWSDDLMGFPSPLRLYDTSRFRKWLDSGFNADMNYLAKEEALRKREDPSLIMRGGKSIITFIVNYRRRTQYDPRYGRISQYALGMDYHIFVKRILENIIVKNSLFMNKYMVYTDTGPIIERGVSSSGGAGWIGKNSMLINRTLGSFTYIGEIITDLKINSDFISPPDYCGNCNRCIASCPTSAINPDRTIDSSKCISYHTIENRGLIPLSVASKMEDMIFGCDICNDVCPWNRNKRFSNINEVVGFNFGKKAKLEDLAFIDKESFANIYRNSAIKRAGYIGIARNATIAIFNRDRDDPILKDIEKNFNDLRSKEIKILKNQA